MEESRRRDGGLPRRIVIQHPREGARIYIQKCRKCRIQTESDHLLVLCPQEDCQGTMTEELDYYYYKKQVSATD